MIYDLVLHNYLCILVEFKSIIPFEEQALEYLALL